jgi:hypothetical protein
MSQPPDLEAIQGNAQVEAMCGLWNHTGSAVLARSAFALVSKRSVVPAALRQKVVAAVGPV